MPQAEAENAPSAAVSPDAEVDVRALFDALQQEVRRVGPVRGGGSATSLRLNARAAAERLWRVTADRPLGGRAGAAGTAMKPVKLAVRKLARWYVEPVFADQRAFNDAALKLIDDLTEQVETLEARVRELESSATP